MHEGEHKWISLKGEVIEVRLRSATNKKVVSVFEVVEICEIPGCWAGRSRDGKELFDVRAGERVHNREIIASTSPLFLNRKEKK